MEEALVTTLVPTYRRPALLRRAIESALAQTAPSLRVCVFDNASGDSTPQVVAELAERDPRVRYQRRPRSLPLAANFASALETVRTPFFSFLADDDLLLPGFYEAALAAFDRHPEAMFVATTVLHVDAAGSLLRGHPGQTLPAGLRRPPESLRALVEHGPPNWTGILFRREVLDLAGGLDPAAEVAADMDFELRIAALCPVAVIPDQGAIYFRHQDAGSAGPRVSAVWPCWRVVIEKLAAEGRIPEPVRRGAELRLRSRLAGRLFRIGIGSARRRSFGESREAARVLRQELRQPARAALVEAAAAACHLPAVPATLDWLVRRSRPYHRTGLLRRTLKLEAVLD